MPQHHQLGFQASPVLMSHSEGGGDGPNFEKQPSGDAPQSPPEGAPNFDKAAAPQPPQDAPIPPGYSQPPGGYPAQQPGYGPPAGYQQAPAGYPVPPVPPVPPGGYGQPQQAGWPQGPTFELAGWWPRVGAQLLDGLIIMLLVLPLVLIGVGVGALSFNDDTGGGAAVAGVLAIIVLVVIYFIVALAYAPYTMAKYQGATLGKKWLGIRVVRVDGQPMDFGSAAIREIAIKGLLINGLGATFTLYLAPILNYLWPLWDSEHRALHDMIAKTRVVRA